MCGIAGFVSRRSVGDPRALIVRMCDTIVHRGPDEDGYLVDPPVVMGMRRLSIIDLSGGSQPICNEDRSVRLVFNGEIYNFRELRKQLETRGHVFTTHTDSEVIVHAYEQYGLDFPRHLNGMFAVAIHDAAGRKVVLARDHIGIKPLYVHVGPAGLVFGSEVKALLASGLVPRELDVDALAQFLTWEYVPGRATLHKGIRRLPPAHLAVYDLDSCSYAEREFWDVADQGENELSVEEWRSAVDEQVTRSVRMQLVSDVPLGGFLSGGVDSSLVAANMGGLKAFTIGFDDQTYNELGWAKKVADHLGVRHVTEIIKPDIGGMFQGLMKHMDDPIGDFSIFPTYMVSRLARREVTVSLSGDGGDELFAGYETHAAERLASRTFDAGGIMFHKRAMARLQSAVRPSDAKKGFLNKSKRFLEGLGYPVEWRHARWRAFMPPAMTGDLFLPDAVRCVTTPAGGHIEELFGRARRGGRDPVNSCLYVDLRSYLSDNILPKVDRMSMAVSLEARVPLLDRDMVELAFQIPGRMKMRGGETKSLLRSVAAARVPGECIYRHKQGFSIPIKVWLRTTLRGLMEERLSESRLSAQGIFRPAAVKRLVREHLDCRANHSHLLWGLIVFQAWHEMWMEE
ncbi:MAG: asparagine synthase (glutamine-hydrolyzing) [Lentisphaerae bacterium]|nr:asparagine synthase (glutamine-hydrolyzing) [Lentisphaerota bacterium]